MSLDLLRDIFVNFRGLGSVLRLHMFPAETRGQKPSAAEKRL